MANGFGTKLANPATLPVGTINDIDFSPDNKYVAICMNATPYIHVYNFDSINGVIGSKLNNPTVLPGGIGRGISFSPDGKYLAVAHNTAAAPAFSIYNFDSINGVIGAKLANPSTLPNGTVGYDVNFSPDGKYIAVAIDTTPWMHVYNFDSTNGVIGSRLSDPAVSPTYTIESIRFSPDGKYLAFGINVDPRIHVYNFDSVNGVIGSKLANPDVFSKTSFNVTDIRFSPDSKIIYVGYASGSSLPLAYKINSVDGILEGMSKPQWGASGIPTSVGVSPNGKYVCYGCNISPFAYVYPYYNAELTFGAKLDTPSSLVQYVYSTTFSNDGKYLAFGTNNSPYIHIYNFNQGYIEKFLLQDGADILKINNNGATQSIASTPVTKTMFDNNGAENVNLLTRSSRVITKAMDDSGSLGSGKAFQYTLSLDSFPDILSLHIK